MEKKYNLIYQSRLETYVNVDGQMVSVSFSGSKVTRNIIRRGHFITRDPKLQKALEADAAYGCQWILDTESEKRFNESKKTKSTTTPVVNPPVDPPTTIEPPADTTEPPIDTTEPITESDTTTEEPVSETPVTEETKPAVDPEIAECTNYTLAKNYLVKYFDAKRPEIISEEKLREYAKSKGIIFPEFAK